MSYTPGLLKYVTVFSREPNTLSDGAKRVDVTKSSTALTQLLTNNFGAARAKQIAEAIRKAGAIHSVLEFYVKSRMTEAEFVKVSPKLTKGSGPYVNGLINVNTASATVLECVPGITSDLADQIISARQSQETPVTNLSWVRPILGDAVCTQAGPYFTAQTFQMSADVAAVGRHGRGYRRTLFVIDNSTGTPQIVYRRNLTYLGWALGAEERQNLASAQASAPQRHEARPERNQEAVAGSLGSGHYPQKSGRIAVELVRTDEEDARLAPAFSIALGDERCPEGPGEGRPAIGRRAEARESASAIAWCACRRAGFLTASTDLPDVGPEDLRGYLELRAEQEFAIPASELRLGYCAYSLPDGQRRATLAALSSKKLEAVERMLRIANRRALSISLALDRCLSTRADVSLSDQWQSYRCGVTAGGGVAGLRRSAAR